MLMQATALDLGAHFWPELDTDEQDDIKTTANITSSQSPQVIVSLGNPAQLETLASYSNATHTPPTCEEFDQPVTESTVYMYGTLLSPNHDYRVAYYDGDDANIDTQTKTSGASGNVSSQHTFVYGTDVAGDWHVIICETDFTPPDSYDSSWSYTITSDDFAVHESAIPEFPTIITAIVAFGLCAGIYLWMRRKAIPVRA